MDRPRWWLARAQPRRGQGGVTRGLLTGAWTTVRRRCIDGGTLAPSSYDAGEREDGRRWSEGARCSTRVTALFYRVGREAEASRCLQWPVMKEAFNATSYRGIEEGKWRGSVPFNGEMMEEATRRLFPFSGGGRGTPWGRREAGRCRWLACSASVWEEEVGWADWAKKAEWAGKAS
jgi:hypothetical protein